MKPAAIPAQESLTWANISQQLLDFQQQPSNLSESDALAMTAEAGQPLDFMSEELVLVRCRNCGKTLFPESFASHVARCSGSEPRRLQLNDDPHWGATDAVEKPVEDEELSLLMDEPAILPKPEDFPDFQGLELKRKRKEIIDLDLQCGVTTAHHPACTRPITCQIHSTYAKSLVEGRSSDLRTLFRKYQLAVQEKYLGSPDPSINEMLYTDPSTNQHTFFDSLAVPDRPADCVLDQDFETFFKFVHQPQPLPPLAFPMYICSKRRINSLRMRDIVHAVLHRSHRSASLHPLHPPNLSASLAPSNRQAPNGLPSTLPQLNNAPGRPNSSNSNITVTQSPGKLKISTSMASAESPANKKKKKNPNATKAAGGSKPKTKAQASPSKKQQQSPPATGNVVIPSAMSPIQQPVFDMSGGGIGGDLQDPRDFKLM